MKYVIASDDGEMLSLADKNGNIANFEFLEIFVFDGREYAALLEKGDDMISIMRFKEAENGQNECYFSVDSDEEFNAAYKKFKKEYPEYFE